jgi:hypothetical protein
MNEDLFNRANMDAQPRYDSLSARDDLTRREMEYGSQMLLRAMIRELEAMGKLSAPKLANGDYLR